MNELKSELGFNSCIKKTVLDRLTFLTILYNI